MSISNVFSKCNLSSILTIIVAILFGIHTNAQQLNTRDFVIYSETGSYIGSSITINNGLVGSQSLVQSTGSTIFNTNIYSGDKVNITNSNTINGLITAANSSSSSGDILSIGSNSFIGGNIDVKGNITIGGGTVSGKVTHPVGTVYNGPVPALGEVIGVPQLPTLPGMPAITVFPAAGTTDITNNSRVTPGAYRDVILGSNKTLTLNGPGVYVFNSFHFSGSSTKIVFDFNNATTGNIYIYIHGDADFGKLNASTLNGGSPSRIYLEIHGNGSTSSVPGYSYIIANGSSGGGSKGLGTIWATNGGINIGSGTGSSTLTGAFYSSKDIIIQSGATINYAPFGICVTANAGADQNKCGTTVAATLAANPPGNGVGTWSIVSGPSTALSQFSNVNDSAAVFTPAGGTGAYTLRWTISGGICGTSTDDVVINFDVPPTTANAGPDQIGSTTCGLTTVNLGANTPIIGTGNWSIVSGVGSSFGNAASPTSTFNGLAGNTYTLRWTITNNPCPSSSDDVIIRFNQNPMNINAGPDKPLDFSTLTKITGTSGTSGVTYSWQAINGGIIDPNYSSLNNDTIKVSVAGTYILNVSSSVNCFTKDTIVITGRLTRLIGSELQSIYDNNTTDTTFFDIENGYVLIDVIALSGFRASVAQLLMNDITNYGLRDTIPNGTSKFIITGFFPVSHLPNLNSLFTQINYIRPHYSGRTNSGLVNSAGDTTVRSYLVRPGYGVDGTGIKIGVLSDSYATITAGTTATLPLVQLPPGPQTFNTNTAAQDISNGDLPGDTTFAIGGHVINPNGFTKNVHIVKDYPFVRSDEGRAMLQIIHDVAPGAELYFRTGLLTAGDFAAGIYQLQNAGCQVIVDDLTYPTEPFLKDGVVAQAVDSVVKQGATYFSAAGNFAGQAYEKNFNPAPVPTGPYAGKMAHNFSGGDLFQQVKLPPGNYLFVLQWVDNIYSTGETAGTRNDLDFYLTPKTDGTSLVGYNRDNTNGDPIEFIPITVLPGSDSIFNVFIVNNTTTGNPARIKYIVYRDGYKMQFLEYNEGTSTITGQANADSAITVGASRYDKAPPYLSTPLIESFSARGGTTTNGVIRNKPNIVAPDGVNTTVKLGQDYPNNRLDGFSNFFGTSAAAPHAAATAALIMQGKKKFLNQAFTTPYEIKSLLENTAIDMDIPGVDLVSGHGLINIDLAMRTFAAPKPSLIKLVTPVTKPVTIPGNSTFTVTVKGDNFSGNSVLYFNDSALASTIILDTVNGLATALIPAFDDNPTIRMYTPPNLYTVIVNGQHLDGGFSNSLYFFEATVTIRVDSLAKKYGKQIPALTAKVYVDNIPLANTSFTLADLGLDSMIVSTTINANSGVGTYSITAGFDPLHLPPGSLLQKYKYTFIQGLLTVAKLPLTISVHDTTVTYGNLIPNIQFSYQFDPTNIANPAALLSSIQNSHQSQLARDAQGHDIFGLVNKQAFTIVNKQAIPIINRQAVTIINGQALTIINGQAIPVVNGQALTIVNGIVTDTSGINLTPAQTGNLSFLATSATLQNTRQINNKALVNGTYVPTTSHVVDITQESILDYDVNAAQTQMLNSISNVNAKGVVNIESYLNGQAITILNGQAVTILNGQAVTILNGQAVTILNGQAVTIINNQAVPIVNSDSRTAVILDSSEIGQGLSPLKSLNIISGLTTGQQFILPAAFINSNFEVTNIEGKLTINKAPLQAKADNISRPYGEDNPPLTLTYSGFAYGEKLQTSDIKGAPSISTTATNNSLVSPPTYPIIVNTGTMISSNYAFSFVNGTLTVTNNACLITHSEFKNFGNTPVTPTSLWLNMETKVSGQLVSNGDYLLFKAGTITFNKINSTPLVNNLAIPDGKIIADITVTAPSTSFNAATNTWVTKVPPGFSSTSDIFITGVIINSSNGFVKGSGNTGSTLKGIFTSNKNFSDQWAYGIAAYVPQFNYATIGGNGQVASINGTYKTGTPIPIITNLVIGGSGGSGNNYTGSSSAFDNFTACLPSSSSAVSSQASLIVAPDETNVQLNAGEVQVIPNPASDYITISYVPKNAGNSRIVLSAFDGRRLSEINNGVVEIGKTYVTRMDVSNRVNGIYMIQIINGGVVTTKKIIIQK